MSGGDHKPQTPEDGPQTADDSRICPPSFVVCRLWSILSAAILLVAGLVYAGSLQGLAVWDDHALLGGSGIGGARSLLDCFRTAFLAHYYRPLTSASFYMDRLIWGQTPFGYHQTNILLHVLATAAVLGFLRALFRRDSVALLGGLLFAVQPAQVSAVAWIGGRTDSLCALWLALFTWALTVAARAAGPGRRLPLLAAVAAYAAALFTKEQAIAALPLVPLAFLWLSRRPPLTPPASGSTLDSGRSTPASALTTHDSRLTTLALVLTAPFLAVTALFAAMWVALGPPRLPVLPEPSGLVLAQGGRTISHYAMLLLAPSPTNMHMFCLGNLQHAGWWPIAAGYAILIAAIAFIGWAARRHPEAAWLAIFAILMLAPVSNFIPLPSLLVAPYRAGTAGLAVAALLAWALIGRPRATGGRRQDSALSTLDSRLSTPESPPHPVTPSSPHPLIRRAPATAIALWWSALTLWGAAQWRDERTLFTTVVHHDPHSVICRMYLASTLLSARDGRGAEGQLVAALDELYGSARWHDSGTAIVAVRTDSGVRLRTVENQGSRIRPEEMVSSLFVLLGVARRQLADRGAWESFAIAATLDQNNGDAWVALAECAEDKGRLAEAERYYGRALALAPDRSDLHGSLGKVLAAEGHWKDARDQFALFVRSQSWLGLGYKDLANAQAHLGDFPAAIATVEGYLHDHPDRTDFRQMLAELRAGHLERTVPEYKPGG